MKNDFYSVKVKCWNCLAETEIDILRGCMVESYRVKDECENCRANHCRIVNAQGYLYLSK